jgi:chorismate dehydratase
MRRLRISAISYLNTAPLMWDFEHGAANKAGSNSDNPFDISYTLPSACARALQNGTADIGIIPAAAYTEIPNLLILPDVAIASRKPVRSILLVSKVPVEKIRSVALDTSSVALIKVLFAKWLDATPTYTAMAPNLNEMLATCDAGLVIGDPALQIDRSHYITLDLAEEWIRYTGKPFVFAFWAVRQDALCGDSRPRLSLSRSDALAPDLATLFRQSRDHGLEPASLDSIVREWSPRLLLSEPTISHYLTENIYYYLDAPCIEGLELFYRYASEIGALPAPPSLKFLTVAKTCIAH